MPPILMVSPATFMPSRSDSPVCTPPGGDSGAMPPILMVSPALAAPKGNATATAAANRRRLENKVFMDYLLPDTLKAPSGSRP